ncbi:MAG: helix-turn-helix domain-containing protein [Candidatus Pacebacteria bacterium]|nr:helix-turn-helix domain-containing protein [Candidatus Paceibacterota bacterium]
MQLQTTLKEFGLTDNETRVYLAALELGQATIQELSKKAGVKRTTVYTTIEWLKDKGLLSQTKKGKKTLFLAENPDRIARFSEKRHQQIKDALPELKSIFNASQTKPTFQFYEGREGFLTVYEDILKDNPKEFLSIASSEHFYEHVDENYESRWVKKRLAKGMTLRWLDFQTPATEALHREDSKFLREIRFLPKGFPFTSTMFLYNNKTVVISGKQKDFLAVVIENQEFSQMFKAFFEMLWLKVK